MSEQHTYQSLPGALEQRAASMLQAFDAQGNHRTGTAADNASAEWLADQVRQLGMEPSHEIFTLSRVDPQLAYARLTKRRIDGVPMFDATFTSAEGVSGRLGPLGSDADNIRLDPSGNRIVIGYGRGALALIDPAGGAKVVDIPLKAHPESFQLDPGSDRIFVNLPETRSIAVVDKATGHELANWQQAHSGNFAMALDNEQQRVFVVFRNPAKFVALAKNTGAIMADPDICGDVDDLFLDAKRQRVYISCGQGFIDVLDAHDPAFRRLGRVATVPGARTSLFVADADRLFLAVPAQAGQAPAIWVYRPTE